MASLEPQITEELRKELRAYKAARKSGNDTDLATQAGLMRALTALYRDPETPPTVKVKAISEMATLGGMRNPKKLYDLTTMPIKERVRKIYEVVIPVIRQFRKLGVSLKPEEPEPPSPTVAEISRNDTTR